MFVIAVGVAPPMVALVVAVRVPALRLVSPVGVALQAGGEPPTSTVPAVAHPMRELTFPPPEITWDSAALLRTASASSRRPTRRIRRCPTARSACRHFPP